MKMRVTPLFLLLAVFLSGAGRIPAQTTGEDRTEPQSAPVIGYRDADGDGANDLFRDADGDGVNDVTGEEYPHGFRFLDENRDGRNDLWSDTDGDGVNDMGWMFGRGERGTPRMNVLDHDGDGVNDVTGGSYTEGSYGGGEYGFVDEGSPDPPGPMIDENGNGIDDRLERARRGKGRHGRDRDVFIDEDGDGICDGRGGALERTRKGGHGHGHHGGGGHH